VDGNTADAHLAASTDDAKGNLAAVRNEDFIEHADCLIR
jgi:hypothetical protein